ncbi:MAG: M20/M25/M40 family metallo-hydrolase, partial [Pseudomonadota bacterium]|nr:M20/M25/M40 family metallo-hydrolase [Pseudomonadota bacterium]
MACVADPPTPSAPDPHLSADLARVRDTAYMSDWAYQRLEELTDRIGPRLSGSRQQAAAVTQVASALRALGARVTLQPVKVPHWIRGEERAELTGYPGRPAGLTQRLHLSALGSSSATPVRGFETTVLVVHDFEELEARASEARGHIVLFDAHFDQRWADNGHAGDAYGAVGKYRFRGPSMAAKLGAAAVLVRSVGGAEYRLPHTGITRWEKQQAPIPAAALAAEDADLIARLAKQGPVTMKLLLTSQTLPDADSFNVIADWPGRDRPEEHVIVSGHLDSWDLATGATDDGVGVMAAAGVIETLQRLSLHPHRTVRFIAWASEETGSQGAQAYFDSVRSAL